MPQATSRALRTYFFGVGCLYQSKGVCADVVVLEEEILGWVTLKGGKWEQGRQ